MQNHWMWLKAVLRHEKFGWNWLRRRLGRFAYPVKLIKGWKRARDKRMGTRKALERFWTDVICNAGENAIHAGQFTRSEINQWYLLFGKHMNLTDLLPKQFEVTIKDQRALKGAILKRIGPETREAFKSKQKEKKTTAKAIRSQFRRAFRKVAV
jgi:hypothetical protein